MATGMHLQAVLLAALLASGCAPTLIEPAADAYLFEQIAVRAEARGRNPELPDIAIVRAAFLRPIMRICDELACYYDPPRLFRIRDLSCRAQPHSSGEAARCRYERLLVSRDGEIGAWQFAETD